MFPNESYDDDDEGNDEGNYVENINRYSMTQARREIFSHYVWVRGGERQGDRSSRP